MWMCTNATCYEPMLVRASHVPLIVFNMSNSQVGSFVKTLGHVIKLKHKNSRHSIPSGMTRTTKQSLSRISVMPVHVGGGGAARGGAGAGRGGGRGKDAPSDARTRRSCPARSRCRGRPGQGPRPQHGCCPDSLPPSWAMHTQASPPALDPHPPAAPKLLKRMSSVIYMQHLRLRATLLVGMHRFHRLPCSSDATPAQLGH